MFEAHLLLFFRSQSEATKIRSIFGLRAGMSSQTRNITQPNLRAIEIAYLALSSCSSSVAPGVTRSQLITRGSMSAQSLIKFLPLARLGDLNVSIGASELISLCHAIRSFSVFEPSNCRQCNRTSCQTIAKMFFLWPSAMSLAPSPTKRILSLPQHSIH